VTCKKFFTNFMRPQRATFALVVHSDLCWSGLEHQVQLLLSLLKVKIVPIARARFALKSV